MVDNQNIRYELRNISRVDAKGRKAHHKGTHGWQVRFQSPSKSSKDINHFFNDTKFGGKDKALEAAKLFRDAMEIEYKQEHPGSLNTMRKTRNKSGMVGVHRSWSTDNRKAKSYTYYYWQTHYPISKNKNTSEKFSVLKYGEQEALRRAIEAREKGLQRYRASMETLFNPPEDINIKIWRYLDFTKFISLLVNKGIYFPRADKFNDQFEGSFSFANKKLRPLIYQLLKRDYTSNEFSKFIKELRKNVFISCWHLNEYESAGMWSLYSKTNEAICIQSTYKMLRDAVDDDIKIGIVRYVDYEKDWIPENNILAPFLYKRKSFEHEREIRAIKKISNHNDFEQLSIVNNDTPEGIWVNLDLNKIIENVYVSPNTTNWFYDIVKNVVDVYKLDVEVFRSSLDEKPFY